MAQNIDLKTLNSISQDEKDGTNSIQGLQENEREIITRQTAHEEVKITFKGLFRYATPLDKFILMTSMIFAIGAGIAVPTMTIVLGRMISQVQHFGTSQASLNSFRHTMVQNALYFIYIGVGEFCTICLSTGGFVYIGERIARDLRARYLEAVLRQNVAFFDHLGTGEITNRITVDTNVVQTSISEKLATILTSLGIFFAAFVISMTYSWRLALISVSSVLAVFVLMGILARFILKYDQRSQAAFDLGTSLAEESIKAIEVITAYGAQEKLLKRFESHLLEAEKWGKRVKVLFGVTIGGVIGILFLNVGLSIWEGSRLLVRSEITDGHIVTITLSMIIGVFALVYVVRNIGYITAGTTAGGKIFSTIDRASPMDPLSSGGTTIADLEGRVEFHEVKHVYPSRPDMIALEKFSLQIPAGKTFAFVGQSGSGKSTCVNLLQRFYEYLSGSITVDGQDIRNLDLRWYRQQMSLVSQEPELFSTTIFNNIGHGLMGSRFDNISSEEKKKLITNAAKTANAHDFIMSLPKGYDTWVGEDGSQLSGGQKQRIAIARAIVKDPKILLLDEATSALDATSEAMVQEAINNAAQGRTTIMIAHRLSTVQNADRIVVMNHGQIIEQGTHRELIALEGFYYASFQAQQVRQASQGTELNATSIKSSSTEIVASEHPLFKPEPDTLIDNTAEKTSPTTSPASRSLLRIFIGFNKNEFGWIALGLFFCIIAGGGTPTHVVLFVKSLTTLAKPPSEYDKLRSDINFWASMYLMLGLTMFLSWSIHGFALGVSSERLLRRARFATFQALLHQDIAFFGRLENSTGSLISFLSVQTSNLAGVSGATLGMMLSVSTSLIAAITVSITISWKLGLVCTSMLPILMACGFLGFYLLALLDKKITAANEQAAGYASEAVSAIRTVASLTREAEICQQYRQQLNQQAQRTRKSNFVIVIMYACAQSVFFFVAALGFWYGGLLISRKEYTLFQLFVGFLEIMFGTQSASAVFAHIPDISKAQVAASKLDKLFREAQEVKNRQGQHLEQVDGRIEITNLSFRYPDSSLRDILNSINVTATPGQHIALVGPSGSGKSTLLSLLERFYEPTAGQITLDGRDISQLALDEYRACISFVSQNSALIHGSVRDNILLGAEREDEEIIQACKQANIYDFIQSLPDGINTEIGNKGSLLSGGQKQRLAIARALIRNPKVLLLDEATSALDSEAEAAVQVALKAATKGRTTISVAHRLRTIQEVDQIYVLDQGHIVDHGTHDELVGRGGLYSQLARLQNLAQD